MDIDWGTVFSVFGTLGGLGGIVAAIMLIPRIRKLKADTHKVDIEAAAAEDTAEDARWKAVIEVQTTHLLKPMQLEIERLGKKVETLETQMQAMNAKYWIAVRWIRASLAWARAFHGDTNPPHPALPPEIQADV